MTHRTEFDVVEGALVRHSVFGYSRGQGAETQFFHKLAAESVYHLVIFGTLVLSGGVIVALALVGGRSGA